MMRAPCKAFARMPSIGHKADHRIEMVLGVIGDDLAAPKPWRAKENPSGCNSQKAKCRCTSVVESHILCFAQEEIFVTLAVSLRAVFA